MSPCSSRGTPSIVVRTPRHASRRLRPPLVAEIRKQAKQKHIRIVGIEGRNNVVDPTHPLGMACDSASEWNSLVISARAERGPQWDVSTQRFMVDYGSDLYFDPTRLQPGEEPPTAAATIDGDATLANTPSGSGPLEFAAVYGGGGAMSSSQHMPGHLTPSRTSLRLHQQQQQQQQVVVQQQLHHQQLQQQLQLQHLQQMQQQQHLHQLQQLQHQQQQQHQHQHQQQQQQQQSHHALPHQMHAQHPQMPLNGMGYSTSSPYGMANGRAHHQGMGPGSYFDGMGMAAGNNAMGGGHASPMVAQGSPMMARQMNMGHMGGIGMPGMGDFSQGMHPQQSGMHGQGGHLGTPGGW